MTQYLYPQNLKATANLWLWSLGLRHFMHCCSAVGTGAGTAWDVHPSRRHAVLRIPDHPDGRYHRPRLYAVCGTVPDQHTAIL